MPVTPVATPAAAGVEQAYAYVPDGRRITREGGPRVSELLARRDLGEADEVGLVAVVGERHLAETAFDRRRRVERVVRGRDGQRTGRRLWRRRRRRRLRVRRWLVGPAA